MVSHGNLMHNEEVIHQGLEHEGPGLGVCWLPPYHDMGLIGGLLQCVYHGADDADVSGELLAAPVSLAGGHLALSGRHQRRTPVWLRSVRRADHAGSASRSTCGTGAWRRWAEPIRPETLERFSAAFGACGFRAETWYPGYGLAEATLLATGSTKADPPVFRSVDRKALANGQAVAVPAEAANAMRLVGCEDTPGATNGWPSSIPTLGPAPGWSDRGDSVCSSSPLAKGYWNRPEETRAVFDARLTEADQGSWLRTGDLGFVLEVSATNTDVVEESTTPSTTRGAFRRNGCPPLEAEERRALTAADLRRRRRGDDQGSRRCV